MILHHNHFSVLASCSEPVLVKMSTRLILVLVSVAVMADEAVAVCSSCQSFHTSTMESPSTVEGHVLVGYQLDSLNVAKCIHCMNACVTREFCVSYNFNWTPDERSLYECQLNYETRNITTLTPKFNFTYHDIITQEETCDSVADRRNYCARNPCRNGGACVSVCDGIRRVKCNCPAGRTGPLCEK